MKARRIGSLGLLVIILAGCGERLATVSGKVTLDGKALATGPELQATVQFVPESGGGTPAIGYVDGSGRYELSSGSQQGLRPGAYLVTASASQIIPAATPGEAAGGRPATPRRYADPQQSGLRYEVRPGDNRYDIPLKSK